jgi:hypothetical protein
MRYFGNHTRLNASSITNETFSLLIKLTDILSHIQAPNILEDGDLESFARAFDDCKYEMDRLEPIIHSELALRHEKQNTNASRRDLDAKKHMVVKRGEDWRVKSHKTGKLWPAVYDSKEKAKDALKAYHAQQGH